MINEAAYLNIEQLSKAQNVQLIAVSKLQSNEKIQALYGLGQFHFAENYVQELVAKASALPEEIIWHFIGHLQSNKVKDVVPYVQYIHSIDNLKLLQEIQKRAAAINKKIKVLLQIKIAQEDTKYGLNPSSLNALMQQFNPSHFTHVHIVGVMGMASFVDDKNIVQQEFQTLKNVFDSLKKKYFSNSNHFKEISMGMSQDYTLAIQEGSTMVRIGSALFGNRTV